MNPSVSLDDFAKRSMRSWNQDGLVDLMFGLACMVCGIINLAGQALPRNSLVSVVAGFVAVGCFLTLVTSVKTLKKRITFRRTGYVAFPDPTLRYRRASRIVGYLYMAVLFFLWHYASRFSGPFFALVMAAALAIGGFKYKLPHLLWLAVVSLFLAAGCYALQTGIEGFQWVMTGLGAAMALTGAWRLRSFLKSNPKPEEPAA